VDQKIYKTKPDYLLELTEKGTQEALRAGEMLRSLIGHSGSVDSYVSPYWRTRQTYQNIMKGLDSFNIKHTFKEDPRLREQEWGNLPDLDNNQLQKELRKSYGHFYYRIGDGESGADVYDRMTGFLSTLYRDFGKPDLSDNVLIVSHGIALRVLLMRWLHWSVEEYESVSNPKNCEIWQLQFDGKHYKLAHDLKRWELPKHRVYDWDRI
jgi:broad specificity phosphatase PhoE